MSSRACRYGWCCVAEKLPIDNIGESSLQAAQRFPMALTCGAFAAVIGAARCVSADLGDGHGVQHAVQLPITGPGEAVAHDVPGGRLERTVPV